MVEERFYTITQVSRMTVIKPHVLRYWEKEFRWLRPRKNSAGRRIYSEHDIELIRLIERLLYKEGYSIAGARRRVGKLLALSNQLQLPLSEVQTDPLERFKQELKEVLKMLGRK
ncbi:transcriptional regulator [candidate division TA06 bacterium B3_TA06]|uniref:Transcriptional regulator n=1 Tax=candidate division TA06 bacterium B3_TA06 TaxID=2012487 RepID=A0A532V1X3_UNCT6|nr:MAG: transcriptional regulator [candidate division TA06 bacterium B3_TA06]